MINRYRKIVDWAIYLFIALCIPFLFIGIQTSLHFRLLPYLWNYGHIALFAAIFWLIFSKWDIFAQKSIYWTLSTTILSIIFFSVPIELIQNINSREYSFLDIIRNCLGGTIVIAFHPNSFKDTQTFSRSKLKYVVVGIFIILSYPLMINTADTIIAYRSFPILSDFESPYELTRWSGNQLEVKNLDASNNHVMGNTFTTDEYSKLTFETFPNNWVGFSKITFRIFNEGTDDQILKLRIHDRHHKKSNWDYNDRFNQVINLTPGWNKISIDLNLVRIQPKNRNMDMSKIEKVILFSHKLQANTRFYFDDFKLENPKKNMALP